MPESAARCRKEDTAAERREARRRAYPAGHLRRPGDGPDREAGHRVRRFRTSACRRSAPLISLREQKRTRGTRAPLKPGGRALAALCCRDLSTPGADMTHETILVETKGKGGI